MASICDTLNCDEGIPSVPSPDCGAIEYGRRIVRLFVGTVSADPFASTAAMQLLSNWTTRLAEPASGDPDLRLVSVGYLVGGVKPEGEVETEETAFGTIRTVETKQMIDAYLKKFIDDTFPGLNTLRCRDHFTLWPVTDKGYVLGGLTGLQFASLQIGNFEIVGSGNGSNRAKVHAEWFAKDDTTPVLVPGLQDEVNP